MTELKTLKDLDLAGRDLVREEAIKWVKFIPQREMRRKDWIAFFNITEEDLK